MGCDVLATDVRELTPGPGDDPRTRIEDGVVMAGFPSPAQDYTTGEIDLTEHLMPNRVSSYLVRARGHSMIGAGIWDGDELIVDRSIRPQPGHVVIAVLDGELTVKRLRSRGGRIVLAPENPGYPEIEVPSMSDLRIWGVVTTCLHHVDRAP